MRRALPFSPALGLACLTHKVNKFFNKRGGANSVESHFQPANASVKGRHTPAGTSCSKLLLETAWRPSKTLLRQICRKCRHPCGSAYALRQA